jgi:hypothetical protein
MENLENIKGNFVLPTSFEHEMGEIERVAQTFAKGDSERFIRQFLEVIQNSQLTDLIDADWSRLENTDSWDIGVGDLDSVEDHSKHIGRDWELLKTKLEKGGQVDAPIIIKIGGVLHLTSGNTRLMVARALGIRPKVVIVDMTEAVK